MQTDKARLLRIASYASVTTALILIAAKVSAWMLTGSTSILATLVDSLLDALASIVNLLAIRWALIPADEDHHFGHGKAEQLAGLAQSAFIGGSAIFVMLSALEKLVTGQTIAQERIGIVVMLFSMVATVLLLLIQKHVIDKTGSVAIAADSMHYRMDLLTNASVIAAMLLSLWGFKQADAVLAIVIVVYMLYGVWGIVSESIQVLMDRCLPPEDEAKIVELAESISEVIGVHELKTRRSGSVPVMQMHLELDGALSLQQAHLITYRVIDRIHSCYPDAEVIIHQDPI